MAKALALGVSRLLHPGLLSLCPHAPPLRLLQRCGQADGGPPGGHLALSAGQRQPAAQVPLGDDGPVLVRRVWLDVLQQPAINPYRLKSITGASMAES